MNQQLLRKLGGPNSLGHTVEKVVAPNSTVTLVSVRIGACCVTCQTEMD